MQDKTCYGTKKVKIQKLEGWDWDCEMVGVLILGIQSLDRAGKLSISPVCDSWCPLGPGQTVQKSGMCLPGSPLGHSWGQGWVEWPPWCDQGGGRRGYLWSPHSSHHRSAQIRASWERSAAAEWTMKECDHQFDLSGRERRVSLKSQVHDTMLVRIACLSTLISDQQGQSPPRHTHTHHTLCQLSQNIL